MLSGPKRLRTARGHGYLVSWKHRLHTNTEPAAAAIVERLLDDPSNVEALRTAIGNPGATLDDLAERLVTGFASGAFALLKTRVTPPVFDAPPETNLVDLLPAQEPREALETLTFEVRDHEGEGVAAHFQVYAPSGDPAGTLPAGERHLIRDLKANANVEVELTAIELPLRAEAEVPVPLGPGGEAPEPAEPAPLGPGGEQPDPVEPPPLGPGGEQPDQPRPAPGDRFAAAILNTGGLCFGTDRETFIPTRLPTGEDTTYRFLTGIDALRCCLEQAQDHPQWRLCVVGHTDTVGGVAPNIELSKRRAQTVQLLLSGERETWAALAVEHQTVLDWQTFLTWAHQVMGMNCDPGELDDDLGARTQAALHRFRTAYNTRYGGHLAIEGPFVTADWSGAFDCYRTCLAEQLGCTVAELPTPRFAEPAILGCGEGFPAEQPGADNRESANNRRVDLVFIGATECPDLTAQPPGSELYGPDCTRPQLEVTASPYAMLRLVLHDDAAAPRGGLRCQLLLGDEVLESTTGPDGYLEFRLPAAARDAVLHVEEPDGRGTEVELQLGTLPAVTDEAGVAGRLLNLGYASTSEPLSTSLTQFQETCELEATGSLDDATRDRLALEHGC